MRTQFKFAQGLVLTPEYYLHACKYTRVYFLAMRIGLKKKKKQKAKEIMILIVVK